MKRSEVIETSRKFAEPFCVTNGTKFRLKDFDPADTGKATSEDKSKAKEMLEAGIQALAELRDILYAQDPVVGAADLSGDGCSEESADRGNWPPAADHHQMPIAFHHRPPTMSQIKMLMTPVSAPNFHHVPSST